MRQKVCSVSNVRVLTAATESLTARAPGLPGLGLVYGPAGFGKSFATRWLAIKLDAIFVTALPIWTPTAMLGAFMREFGARPLARSMPMFDFITRELATRPRPIFLDEADSIVDKPILVETLRIMHDLTAQPLVMIGMAGCRRKLSQRPQLERRILREVEFQPLNLGDARLMASELSEVMLGDDLVAELHRRSRGSAGLFAIELAKAEGYGRRHGLQSLDLGEYEMAAPAAARMQLPRAAAA